MRIHIRVGLIILSVWLCLLPVRAQVHDFLDIDWEEMQIDSVLPVFTHSIPLGADYERYEYRVRVEYPEFEPLPLADVRRLEKMKSALPDWPEVDSYVGVASKQAALYTSLVPIVWRDGAYQRITSLKLTIDRTERLVVQTRAASSDYTERYAASSVLSQGKWVKVAVSETGVYKISNTELRAMGFDNPAKVRLYGHGGRMLQEDQIQKCVDDLKELPLYRRGSDVLFYARGTVSWKRTSNGFEHTQNTYSTKGYYFLTEDASVEPLPFASQESLAEAGVVTDTYPDYALHEKDEFSWLHRGRVFFENVDYKTFPANSYTFYIPGVVPEGSANVKVAFGANSANNSTVKVAVSADDASTDVGTLSIPAATGYTKFQTNSRVFDCSGSVAERTTVTLLHKTDASGYLDYITLNFTRQLALRGAYTPFRGASAGKKDFVVAGADAHTTVWKIVDDGAAGYTCTEMQGTLDNGQYKFTDNVSLSDEYVVVNTGAASFPSVEVVGRVANQDLHAMEAMDMLIVVPASAKWMAQAERLAELHRQYDSLRVAVVRADQIYNEFSSGTPDATAIRRFMKMFYDRAQTEEDAPKYLLLFGDCASDNRMLTTEWRRNTPNDFLLCFQSELSSSETRSYVMEEYFCLLDDDEGTAWTRAKADAAVGRLTVRSLVHATVVVDKIEAYLQNREAGAWKNTVCVLGDDGDANRHMIEADKIVDCIQESNPSLVVNKIYWDAYFSENASTGRRFPEVTQRIREASAEGALMMYYTGHGSAASLSHELAWGSDEMTALRSPRLPLWVTAACDTSPIDLPEDNMGEIALLNENAGAIAFLGATRSTYGTNSNPLHILFCERLFRDGLPMGEALRLAKNAYMPSYAENNLHYVLIGDPALRLSVPDKYRVEVTEVNGKAVGQTSLHQFEAGSLVTLKGEIVGASGNRLTDFNGLVYPSVYGGKSLITCKMNDPGVEEAYQFWNYSQKVYIGSDSVRDGRFTFTFPVPLDINYSEDCGNIYFYAQNDSREEAQGTYGDFFLNGTKDNLVNDSIGPEIGVSLNSTDFVWGDRVHETPLLMLSLYDAEGINATGGGIGHDLIAIIDNDPQKTFVLNSYYTSEPGDYTRGTVMYSLPELEAGEHTLLVRAWDVLNNSSAVEVPFEVVPGLRPAMGYVWNTPNPARTTTTFIIAHNRPQTELTVKLELFDFSGRLLWNHSQTGMSSGNNLHVTWDLTTNGGQPIGNGVYLYRVSLSSAGGEEVTKARKIVVARQ